MMRGRSYLYRGSASPFETRCYADKLGKPGGKVDGVINDVALQCTGHVLLWSKLLNFPMLTDMW